MFTGIIEQTAEVISLTELKLTVERPLKWQNDLQLGESISVNGCCLTLTNCQDDLQFDLSEETVQRTALGSYSPRDLVNLERSMAANGRFGGHIVQGHVDAIGKWTAEETKQGSHVLTFFAPAPFGKYMIEKGSIAVDGISLTLYGLAPTTSGTNFLVSIIPTTWTNTNLHRKKVGTPVNLEFDLVAKYVERLLPSSQ